MHYSRSREGRPVDIISHSSHELNEWLRDLWDAVIWPHCVVKLTHHSGIAQPFLLHRHASQLISVFLLELICEEQRRYTHVADLEFSDGPLGQHRLGLHLDDQIPIVQRLLIKWPVMVTLHLNKRVKHKFIELTPKEPHEQKNHVWSYGHTLPFSTHCVTITMLCTFCSQTIFQKSSLVPGKGPWVAIYSRLKLLPFKINHVICLVKCH